jgi:hypothetical protein
VKGLRYAQLQKAENWTRALNIPESVFDSKEDRENDVKQLEKNKADFDMSAP